MVYLIISCIIDEASTLKTMQNVEETTSECYIYLLACRNITSFAMYYSCVMRCIIITGFDLGGSTMIWSNYGD